MPRPVRGDFVISLVLIPDASSYGPTVDGVSQGAYWQLVTSAFLHVEFTHLALNMIGVWLFGSLLGGAGAVALPVLYLVSALLACDRLLALRSGQLVVGRLGCGVRPVRCRLGHLAQEAHGRELPAHPPGTEPRSLVHPQ